jgi:hypothetical protein
LGTGDGPNAQIDGLSPFLLLLVNDVVSGEMKSLTAKASINVFPLMFVRNGNAILCK